MSWTNPHLVLYHGTVDVHERSILANIDLNHAALRPGSDFGRGLYTTTKLNQARTWAATLVKKPRYAGSGPAVILFRVDRDALSRLDALWFVRGSPGADDFWSLIRHLRTPPFGSDHGRSRPNPWYDIVAGPVSRDWKFKQIVADSDQVSFHTQAAASLLDRCPKGRLP